MGALSDPMSFEFTAVSRATKKQSVTLALGSAVADHIL